MEFDREVELARLEDAYSEYMVQTATVRAEVKEEFRRRIEKEIDRRVGKLTADFGRTLADSPLTVADRQRAIRTKAWGKYKGFLDAAGAQSKSQTERPKSLPEYAFGPLASSDEYVYRPGVDPAGLGDDEIEVYLTSTIAGELEVRIDPGSTEAFTTLAEVEEHYGTTKVQWYCEQVLAAIPDEDKAQFRADFGLEDE